MKTLMRALIIPLIILSFAGYATAQPTPVRGGSGPGFVSDTTGTPTALGALNARALVALAGRGGAEIVVEAGTLVATGACEVSRDNATSWEPQSCWFIDDTGVAAQTVDFTNPSAYTSLIPVWIGSATHVSIRLSAYTSGSAQATARATVNTNTVLVLGWDGNKLTPFSVTSGGALNVAGPLTDAQLRNTPISVTVPDSGTALHRLVSAASTNLTLVLNEAGTFFGFIITNTNASARWVHYYNASSTGAVTVGTTTPLWSQCVPGTGGGCGGVSTGFPNDGIALSAGLVVATTTGLTGSTGVAADELVIHTLYRSLTP